MMYPEVSQSINLELVDSTVRKHLRATVLDVTEKEILINYPIDEDTKKFHFLAKSERVIVIFSKSANTEKQLYKFDSRVIKKINGHIPCIVLEKPKVQTINHIQRRDFLRVPAVFDVKILVSELENGESEILTTTTNISGGGLRLFGMNQPLKVGTNLNGILYFQKDKNMIMEIDFEGEIVNAVDCSPNTQLNEYGIKFKKITPVHQEMIIQFCFKKQIEINIKFN
jgi:c-di-GMP-binding flagellar brake protein YcgR